MRKIEGKKLVLATHNAGKLRELDALLAPFGYQLTSAAALGLPVPAETGTSFEENAYLKASAAARATGLPALADDSGLEADILGGAPGVWTADWAEQADGSRDFAKAMAKLEAELQKTLKGTEGEAGALSAAELAQKRHGRFISVLCVAWPDGHAEYFRGQVEGELIWPPRGDGGFGYDAMFVPQGRAETFGEMTEAEKHSWKPWQEQALSHRARAFKLFAEAMLKE